MTRSQTHTTFLFILLLLLSALSFAQKPTKIKLVKANELRYDKSLGDKVQRLIGNVVLKQDSTLLYCDSAYLYEITNSFDGFGNVRIKASDTLNIYSQLLNYNGNTKLAELHHNVKLIDTRATLYTEHLWYDRIPNIAYYLTGGKIEDSTNTLTSSKGYYYTDLKEAYFKDSVVLVNPQYTMRTDTMLYHTETEVSHFLGPTFITSDDNLIYCENGWYDTRNDKSQFNKNAYFQTNEQKLEGDSLFYDRTLDFGQAFQDVVMTDTVQNMQIHGNYGEFRRHDGFSFITGRAMAVMMDKNDSLYLHADTLWIYFDSAQNVKHMLAYHHTKFYRKDMQGMSDSLVYSFADSTIFLYKQPILWSGISQLTSDSIRIALENNKIDTLALLGSSFIISMDDTISQTTFNQIRGKIMVGYFKNNQMVQVKIFGNAESIFFIREEDGGLTGINKTSSSDMNIYLNDNEVQVITPIKNVDAHMYPHNGLTDEELKLKDFKWIEGRRPLNKEDIFIW
ncbi:MAG: OstA-like protein [Bacteroidales bacterium]